MRSLLFILLLLVVAVVAVGFYRGWFSVATTRDDEAGRQGVRFEIDRNKIKPDVEKVKKTISGGSVQAGEKSEGR